MVMLSVTLEIMFSNVIESIEMIVENVASTTTQIGIAPWLKFKPVITSSQASVINWIC